MFKMTGDWTSARVHRLSGIVIHGKIVVEPHNLGRGWWASTSASVRASDAGHQRLRDAGNRQLRRRPDVVPRAGHGLGSALIVDGVVESMELLIWPSRKARPTRTTSATPVGDAWAEEMAACGRGGRRPITDRARSRLRGVGRGNARKLKKLPEGAILGNNDFAFVAAFACGAGGIGAGGARAGAKRRG